ncbi:zinc finger, CCHC-type containing protein [Tanacetum coccineum]
MGDTNLIRTFGDYSKPSYEGYRNTIELPVGNNVVPLRSDTIRLVQNGCPFHRLRSEDPNQHLKDFLKLVDPLDLDGENRERTRLRLFKFSLRDQASGWLERLPDGSITTWKDLTTRFLAQFLPPGITVKLCNDILMFQQHQGKSLSEAWTRFKDLLRKVPHHGINLWLQCGNKVSGVVVMSCGDVVTDKESRGDVFTYKASDGDVLCYDCFDVADEHEEDSTEDKESDFRKDTVLDDVVKDKESNVVKDNVQDVVLEQAVKDNVSDVVFGAGCEG